MPASNRSPTTCVRAMRSSCGQRIDGWERPCSGAAFPAVSLCSLTNPASAAATTCARHATGDLAFINPDTVVAPGWLMPLVSALEEDASAGWLLEGAVAPGSLINTCGTRFIAAAWLSAGWARTRRCWPRWPRSRGVGAVPGCAGAVRDARRVDESFFLYMEDTDFRGAPVAGLPCLYVPDSVIYRLRAAVCPLKTFYQSATAT